MAHDVFISHSAQDKTIANAVCAALEAAKIRCWIAPRDIRSGENWAEAITKAVKTSRVMVLLFTESSNRSKQVAKELTLAINSEVIVVPFKIDDTLPSGLMEYYLSDTHWLDAMNPPSEKQINNLVETVKYIFGNKEETPPDSWHEKASNTPDPVEHTDKSGVSPVGKRKVSTMIIIGAAAVVVIGITLAVFFIQEPAVPAAANDESSEEIVFNNFDEPSWYIDCIKAYVSDLKFFEAGYYRPKYGYYDYDEVFAKKEARYIYWDLLLVHSESDEDRSVVITHKWYNPSGRVEFIGSQEYLIPADWSQSVQHGIGYGDRDPGALDKGTYYVELLVDETVVAAGSFKIE